MFAIAQGFLHFLHASRSWLLRHNRLTAAQLLHRHDIAAKTATSLCACTV
jgi:hypothetical protein